MPYPPETQNFHFEMELLLAIGSQGFRVSQEDAHELIYGYACGLDMTRRDLQLQARDKGRPWDLGKDVENSSVCSEIVPMLGHVIDDAAIALEVNGQTQQSSNVNKLIWNIREIIADLSLFYHLEPGDLIYTGTPEGVNAVVPGDLITGRVDGVFLNRVAYRSNSSNVKKLKLFLRSPSRRRITVKQHHHGWFF